MSTQTLQLPTEVTELRHLSRASKIFGRAVVLLTPADTYNRIIPCPTPAADDPINDLDAALGERFFVMIVDDYPGAPGPDSFNRANLKTALRRADHVVLWDDDFSSEAWKLVYSYVTDARRVRGLVLVMTNEELGGRDAWLNAIERHLLPRAKVIDLMQPARPIAELWGERECDQFIEDMPAGLMGPAGLAEIYRGAIALSRKGHPLQRITDTLEYAAFVSCRPAPSPEKIRTAIQWGLEDAQQDNPPKRNFEDPAPTEAAALPRVRYTPDKFVETADAVEQAMLENQKDGPLLSRGGAYVVVRKAKAATVTQLQSGNVSTVVHTLDNVGIREYGARSCNFEVFRKGAWIRDRITDDVTKTLEGRGGGKAPALTGLLYAPTILNNGVVLDEPGFDRATGLYLAFDRGDFWAMSTSIGRVDAKTAYRYLQDLFAEFPFKEPLDCAIAVAALITGLVRHTCGQAPGFLFASPTQGTGKTTLASVIGQIVTGCAPGATSWPESDEEVEKVILSSLRLGLATLLFDNLRSGTVVRSDKLAKLLTSDTFNGRVLGLSQMTTLPTAALVLLTGNNVKLEGDMPTRILECYLDARVERPDRREFTRDIRAWVKAHRAEIVRAALTITQAYISNGAPPLRDARPTRFPQWDRMVRFPIMWAGGPDVAAKMDRAFEADPSIGLLRDLLAAWQRCFGDTAMRVGEVLERIESAPFDDKPAAELSEAIQALVSDRRNVPITKQALGVRLGQFAGRPVDGLVLGTRYDSSAKSNLWRVTAISGE